LIYLDSCLVIYLTEKTPPWNPRLVAAMSAERSTQFVISPLVAMECLVQPLKRSDVVTEAAFNKAFANFDMLEMTRPVFFAAAELRARHQLKTPDALHLACAQHHRCTGLWTADQRFRNVGAGFVRVLTA
jgi:predicted nucleic acid-binding protein